MFRTQWKIAHSWQLAWFRFQENKQKKTKNNSAKIPCKITSTSTMILGDRACCLKCMAAWILLDPTQKPIFGRDLNTHMAEYRSYYKDQPSFPVTITIAGREWKSVWGGGRRWLLWYFSILTWSLIYVPQYDCSDKLHQNVCWSDCLWPRIKKIKEPTHQYNPDPDFPWKESDTNSPNENNYTKMHLPNYKMFTLIFLASPERHPDPTAEILWGGGDCAQFGTPPGS